MYQMKVSSFARVAFGRLRVHFRKAKAPCPRCGSWNATVENDIFVCHNCGFEG